MKKTLFTTTALGVFAASSAFAGAPTVTVGGYADFQVGSADQESIYESANFSRSTHTATDTQINIDVEGKTDSGLGYGAHIELEADVNRDSNTAGNNNAEQGYIFVESGFGRVEAGATGDAGNALKVDAASFARATGGIGGDFYKYVDLSSSNAAANNADYYILPGLPSAVGLPGEVAKNNTGAGSIYKDRAYSNKISYYTPRVQGVQLGVSFTPDQGERGTSSGFSGNANNGGIEDVWNVGLNYKGQYNDLGVEAAITAEWGDAETNTTAANDGLEAYSAGLQLDYAGFTLGGSYGAADEFGSQTSFGEELSYYTAGAAYEFGPFAASVTYMNSKIESQGAANAPDSEFNNLSVGADYKLAPGLTPYVEVSFFETDDNAADTATTIDNEGTVFIVGTQLNF